MNYLCTKSLSSDTHHGYRKSKSCETHLVTLFVDIVRSLNDRDQLTAALLHFNKVFAKLEHYAFRGELSIWIKNHLSDRTQKVTTEEIISDSLSVRSQSLSIFWNIIFPFLDQ